MTKIFNKKTIFIFAGIILAAVILTSVAAGFIIAFYRTNADFTDLNNTVERAQNYLSVYTLDDRQHTELEAAITEAEHSKKAFATNQAKLDNSAEKLNSVCDSLLNELFAFDSEKTYKFRLVTQLAVNGADSVFNADSETFYFPLDMDNLNNLNLLFTAFGKTDEPNIFLTFADTTGNKIKPPYNITLGSRYVLQAVSKSYKYNYNIIFTGLPIIQLNDINLSGIGDGNDYVPCVISLTSDSFLSSEGALHIRGGIARSFPKKSYEIMFTEADGSEKDVSLLGMRSDSEYILDAMYIDKSRMRTRVCNDLWNDFAVMPLYTSLLDDKIHTGTYGKFVEVFSDGEYIGLYCLTEKIDRKQLQLKKYDVSTGTIHGVLYKGRNWDANVRFYDWFDPSDQDSWWGGFEQKYPDEKYYWNPISDFVKFFVQTKDDAVFAENVGKYIDTDNFVDYTLMLCVTYAFDNTGKNAYWGTYDIADPEYGKLFITIWDMDATFGRSWDGSVLSPKENWIDSGDEHISALFSRLVETNADGFRDKLKARWNELKATKLSPETLMSYFDKYFDLLEDSGAFARESAKWSECGLDPEAERAYIKSWITQRFKYVDHYINELQ